MSRLIAVVGATAAGKTALAIALARRLDGEIINADSRQVYRGMDIGTAKPTAAERAVAPHWMVDVADPDETFTLASFLDLANVAIDDVRARSRMPIVAGGTGQYVWALLEGWRVPRVPPDVALRTELEALAAERGPDALAAMLRDVDAPSAGAIDPRNVRRVIRAIEVTRETGRPFSSWQAKEPAQEPAPIVGLRMDREALYARIDARVDAMLARGFAGEVEGLASRFGCDAPAMSGIGYRQICEYLRGACSLAEAIARTKTETHRLARMQHTWFRRDDARITWLMADSPTLVDDAFAAIESPRGS